jgi:class 3 adenylate cyclase/predicted ATPase
MSGIQDWLRSQGLSEYADRFAENRIDLAVLPELTDDDLKELGVLLGDRRRILRLIAEMYPPSSARPPAQRLEEAERRQVTVMFADLVGSTALAARMDPEDLRDLFSAYSRCVDETVSRFSGTVAQYMGDGVVVYFGYPRAHEDDAEQAVRAGLELVAAVAGLKTRVSQQIRVGIATGLVVVGNLIPTGVVGETPNLAARLQSIAKPNTVVISDGTRRLIGDLFKLEDLGLFELKGIAAPVQAWSVLQASSSTNRFDALHSGGMTDLIGRDEEFDLLRRRWIKATEGEGQVVMLSGEAGIGKSRLAAEIMEFLAKEPHRRLRHFCSPQQTNSALHPIISQLERAAGFAREDTPPDKLDKLDSLLRKSATPMEDAGFIADLLSLPNDGRYPENELAPRQRRQKTMDALVRRVETLSDSAPVLMIFEDAHWADPTSIELVGRLVSRIENHRVLIIVTFRPEFEPPWIGQAYITVINLNRLTPWKVVTLIDRIVGNHPLPEAIRQDIIERTDGVPLFVEEMTKAVLETASEGEARRTAALIPPSTSTVPATLHASLMARLDRLGPAKELAQIAAAIGREFSHELLAKVARRPDAMLYTQLESLVRAGLLFRQGAAPDATYLFKHALVQDAAYGLLLREPRRELHARIAETLEGSDVAETKPELLARHCADAGQFEKAALLWGKAGRRSAQRSALDEAAQQITRALDLIATLPGTSALRRNEIDLQVELITPLLHVRGYAAQETRAAVARARRLIEQAQALGEPPEDPLVLFSVLYGLWVANLVAFNGDVTCELAGQFLSLAEEEDESGPRMIGHRLMGLSLLHAGNVAEARAHLDRAIALYDPVKHRSLASRFGQDVGAASLTWRSLALWLLGYPKAAVVDAEQAIRVARDSGHTPTLAYGLNFCVLQHSLSGDFDMAGALIDEFIAVKDQIGSQFWGGWAMVQRGSVLALTEKHSAAVESITTGVAAIRSTGNTMWMPLWLSLLARAEAEAGRLNDAMSHIAEAMTTTEATKEKWCEAEVYRTAGDIALLSPTPDAAQAEAYYARALDIARTQETKSWELRAAISLARHWRRQGKRRQAYELLAGVHGWFAEGFDTLDLKQSKRLLGELAD